MLVGLDSDPRAPGSLPLLTAFMSGLSPLTTHKEEQMCQDSGTAVIALHTG